MDNRNRPTTIDEAVDMLIVFTHPSLLHEIASIEEGAVCIFEHFNRAIRNLFGLWSDNEPLRVSCGSRDAEDCSYVIMRTLRTKLIKEKYLDGWKESN